MRTGIFRSLLVMTLAWSGVVNAAIPGAVQNLTSPSHSVNVASTTQVISFNWDQPANTNAVGYSFVLDSSAGTVPDVTIENSPASATSTTTAQLADGTYYFHVRGVGSLGEGSETTHIGPFTIDTTGPAAVTNASATAGNQQVSLSWTTPATADFAKVVIRYRTDGVTPSSPTNGQLVTENTTTAASTAASFVHSGLTNGTGYSYGIFALDGLGNVSSVVAVAATPVAPDPELDSISPIQGGVSQNAFSITFSGSAFNTATGDTAKVKIGNVTASSISSASPSSLTAVFDLRNFAPGTYSATVNGAVLENAFTVQDDVAPEITVSPAPATYTSAQQVTLSANESGSIYYTLDGTEPTTSSSKYSAALSIGSTTTLRYFGVDTAGNASSKQSVTYTINVASQVSSVSPTQGGDTSNNLTVTFTGSGFNVATSALNEVKIGTVSASSIASSSATSVVAVFDLTSFDPGTYPVTVGAATLADAFTVNDATSPTATISPAAGTFNSAQQITLTANETATLYYTLDGSNPDKTSTQYSAPFTLSNSATVKYIAYDSADNASVIGSAAYTINVAAQLTAVSPNQSGNAATALSITLTGSGFNVASSSPQLLKIGDVQATSISSTSATSIAAVFDLSTLSPGSYAVSVDGTTLASAFTVTDTIAPTVTASPSGGTFTATQTVSLAANETATVYYTVDGSEPTTSSAQYSSPLSVTSNMTLRYFAVDSAGNTGSVQTQSYVIELPLVKGITSVSPAQGGTASGNLTVTISGHDLPFSTLTASDISLGSSQPLLILSSTTESVTAIFYLGNMNEGRYDVSINEHVLTDAFSVVDTVAPTVTASPGEGSFTSAQLVSLTANEPADIYYTLDGSEPDLSSSIYGSPLPIGQNTTLRYFAVDRSAARNRSATQSQSFVLDSIKPIVTPDPVPGEYDAGLQVSLHLNEAGRIHVTVDGSYPTVLSPLYSSPITLEESGTIRYFAFDKAGNVSSAESASYTIREPEPGPITGDQEIEDDLTDIELGEGASVSGGSLGGNISGDPASPALVNSRIRDGSTLSNIVIGENAELGENVTFGPGVRFSSPDVIPDDFDLAQLLPQITPEGSIPGTSRLRLSDNVVAGSQGGLLDDINSLPAVGNFGQSLQQTSDGQLNLELDGFVYRVDPVEIRRAPVGTPPGVYYTPDGDLSFVNENGIEIRSVPGVNHPQGLSDLAGEINLDLQFDNAGNLVISEEGSNVRLVARPSLGAQRSERTQPGAYERANPLLPGRVIQVFVYEQDGELYEQSLLPAPHNWQALSAMLGTIDGVTSVALGVDGVINVSLFGQVVRFMMDYAVIASDDSAAGAGYEDAGDLNGDGTADFLIIFADGSRQYLFVLP